MALPPLPEAFGNYALPDFIHLVEPEAVVWWPQAPGWRILAVAALLAVGVAAWRRWRRWRRDAYRREALKALRDCRNLAPEARLQTTARILKAAALAAFPRHEIAALSGDPWLDWLDGNAPQAFSSVSRRLLGAGQYRSSRIPDDSELAILAQDCERWLSGHRKATQ